MNCVVVDDEPLARECIVNYVRDVNFLRLLGVASNPVELSEIISGTPVDLVFLDIEMPIMNGIDYLKMTTKPPMVVITTAYPNYALEGFQLDVLDYLVKPITFNRFFKAVTKSKEYHQLVLNSVNAELKENTDFFFIKCDYKFEKIFFNEVMYIQSMQNYITIHTIKGKYITLLPLKNIEEKLPVSTFIRTHKSYIVSIPMIESIENNDVLLGLNRIPISRNHHAEVLERVVNDRLWKK